MSSQQPLSFDQFQRDVLEIYSLRAPQTRRKLRQVLAEFAVIPGVHTIADLGPLALARWLAAHPERKAVSADSLFRSLRAALGLFVDARALFGRRRWIEPEPPGDLGRHHSQAEIVRLLDYLGSRRQLSWQDHRLYALCSLVAYTGLRRMEAILLKPEDVDAAAAILAIVARRKLKTRSSSQPVPIPPELQPVLAEWLPYCRGGYLFAGTKARGPWTGGSGKYRALEQLRQAGKQVGIEGLSFQTLRHSWATHAESAWGISEGAIKRILRHTTLRTQAHYRHPDLDNLRAIAGRVSYAAASP